MDEATRLAFMFASDLSKQLITLAVGVLGISITFTRELVKGMDRRQYRLIAGGWVLYFVSLVLGIWHLMALTGILAPAAGVAQAPFTIGPNARLPAVGQVLSFLLGTVLIVLYAAGAIRASVRIGTEPDGGTTP